MACMSSSISATTTAASKSTRAHMAICSGRLSIIFTVFPRHLHGQVQSLDIPAAVEHATLTGRWLLPLLGCETRASFVAFGR